jgi:hypothetical protein
MTNSNGVAASWNEILVLVRDIKEDMKSIENDNAELDSLLRTLGASFRSEGFNIIKDHIASTKKQIDDAAPAFNHTLKSMTAYAIRLKQFEDTMTRSTIMSMSICRFIGR